jgi:hypothetical protein
MSVVLGALFAAWPDVSPVTAGFDAATYWVQIEAAGEKAIGTDSAKVVIDPSPR